MILRSVEGKIALIQTGPGPSEKVALGSLNDKNYYLTSVDLVSFYYSCLVHLYERIALFEKDCC